jgi:hypothetical protein
MKHQQDKIIIILIITITIQIKAIVSYQRAGLTVQWPIIKLG